MSLIGYHYTTKRERKGEQMEGKKLLDTLSKIEGGELYDIFNLLPDSVGGEAWLLEIQYTTGRVAEYIQADEDYSLEDLRELGFEYANGQCEDYYYNINAEVQALSLWGLDEVSELVAELNAGAPYPTFTELNAQYLFAGKRMVWDAVVDQAFTNTEEMAVA
jgi:hypothetical protein